MKEYKIPFSVTKEVFKKLLEGYVDASDLLFRGEMLRYPAEIRSRLKRKLEPLGLEIKTAEFDDCDCEIGNVPFGSENGVYITVGILWNEEDERFVLTINDALFCPPDADPWDPSAFKTLTKEIVDRINEPLFAEMASKFCR